MEVHDYLTDLVAFKTPSSLSNESISDYVDDELRRQGFETERIEYRDARDVLKVNIVGRKGSGQGGFAYFAHTDVVPADDWSFSGGSAFQTTVADGRVYGRGSCDMKGSLACMLSAASRFEAQRLRQPIYVTCTADEEVGYGGAIQVHSRSHLYRELVDNDARGVIGEPTLLQVVHAHKGGISFEAISHGRASHSSMREGLNANLAMIPFLSEMKALHDETEADPKWHNTEFDPPTVCWNIGINDDTHAVNITAPQSICTVYFRIMPGVDAEHLMQRVRKAADRNGLDLRIRFECKPMYTASDSAFVREVLDLTGSPPSTTVAYGTDGAVFEDLRQRIVFGPGSIAQAHTADEWIALDQLSRGTDAFACMIEHWCT